MRTSDEFLADVAAVYIGDQAKGSFGSGRLIAPGLVLTAGHVVDYPAREAPARVGWKIALIGERGNDGRWTAPAHDAEVVWRGKGDLDLALLRLIVKKRLEPKLKSEFASHKLVGPIGEVVAAGFPDAWASDADSTHDYSVWGGLRIASQLGPYAWSVLGADKPDKPRGWKGMSGSAVCRLGPDDKVHLFGVVQEVPANFSEGLLEVARVSYAFEDADFRSHLQAALGVAPVISPFEPAISQADLGIARIFQARTRAFTDEYLVSETGPVPFGGRDAELRRLDAWLLDPQSPPRMLVTAPAGRGKSALLVHWMKNLQDGDVCGAEGWQLAFMPISIRTGTNRPEVFYEGLARRLAEITRQPLPSESFRDTDGFRYAVRDQLDRLASDGKPRVILVIDGVDEALEGSFDPAVLPTPLPMNIRLLLSARWQVGDRGSDGWLRRLGWDRGVKVTTFEVDRLGAEQIADVLTKLGAPADVFAREPGVVDRLVKLTEGEPLLVRYYAEDLWGESIKGVRIARDDLAHIKAGFDSYFKRWFELQERLWNEESGGVNRHEVDAVLSVMAFALGPLLEADLLYLMDRLYGIKAAVAVDRMLEPLRRWVFGSGRSDAGYVLSHPKIGEYLQENRFAARALTLRQGYADWCKAHCISLNEKRITSDNASPYCLQFLPEHLKQINAPPDDFMLMVNNGWRLAWENYEGGQRGFSGTVQTAFLSQRNEKSSIGISARWRCALVLSSTRNVGQQVPARIALAAVEARLMTVREATYLADLKGASAEKVRFLAGLASVVPYNSRDVLESAGSIVDMIDDNDEHAEAFAALAPRLPPDLLERLLQRAIECALDGHSGPLAAVAPCLSPAMRMNALAAVRSIKDVRIQIDALISLARNFPEMDARSIFRERLSFFEGQRDDIVLAEALILLSPYIPTDLLGGSIELASRITDESTRTGVTRALSGRYPPESFDNLIPTRPPFFDDFLIRDKLIQISPHLPLELLGDALSAAAAIRNERARAYAIRALAPRFRSTQLLSRAVEYAKAIVSDEARSVVLTALAPHLTADLVTAALSAAISIRKEPDRTEALSSLSTRLSPEQLVSTIAACRAIGDQKERRNAINALAAYMPPELVLQAFLVAKSVEDENDRVRTLVALAPLLLPEVMSEVLATAQSIKDERRRAEAFAALAPRLTPALAEQALADTTAIRDEEYRVLALKSLLPRLKSNLAGQTIALARIIKDDLLRFSTLIAIAPHLSNDIASEALALTRSIKGERNQATALGALAPHLAVNQLGEALTVAAGIKDEYYRREVLAVLAPFLPPTLLRRALSDVASMMSEYHRAALLSRFAPHLPKGLLNAALDSASAIQDTRLRASALTAIAHKLPQKERQWAIDQAFSAAITPKWNAGCIVELVPLLSTELQLTLLADVKSAMRSGEDRVAVLTALAETLPVEKRISAIEQAFLYLKDVENERNRAFLTTRIFSMLPNELSYQAIDSVQSFRSDSIRYELLKRMAPHLSLEQTRIAFAMARTIESLALRANAMAALAPFLTPEYLDEMLAVANAMATPKQRVQAVAVLVANVPLAQKRDALCALIDAASEVPRSDALEAVCLASQQTFELGGVRAIVELADAVNEVGNWYP